MYDSDAGEIEIALTGDSLITRPLRVFGEPEFLRVRDVLRSADVAITNAEMLFHRQEGSPGVTPGGTYMQAEPSMLAELAWMGVDMIAAANNHGWDYGENGMLAHIDNLAKSGIPFAGVGATMAAARRPAYVDTRGGRVALVSMTTSGPRAMYAGHQWREGPGRPGANMIRYTDHYTVDAAAFEALRRMRDALGLFGSSRPEARDRLAFRDHSLGLSAIADTEHEFYLGDLHNPWLYPNPEGYHIRSGTGFSYAPRADESDVQENLQRIWEAKRMADRVVVSIHCHEAGAAAEQPPDMLVEFARAAIDAGADVIHGHGPHRFRGVEIYKERPIFYSIGHFIVQNDTVATVGGENLVRQGLDRWESTPADFFDARSGAEWDGPVSGLPADINAWRDVVATVRFRRDGLEEVRILPIELGYGRPRSQRGRPVVATGQAATEILSKLAALSSAFGTEVEIVDDEARISLG